MRRPQDHTGEVFNNRIVTGRGRWHKPPHGHGYWSWRWRCLECGAKGEAATLGQIKGHEHLCPGKPRGRPSSPIIEMIEKYVPPKKTVARDRLCSAQCRKCRYFFADGRLCDYYLQTGKRRPKVDLRKEPCPVRDTSQRPKTTLIYGERSDNDDS